MMNNESKGVRSFVLPISPKLVFLKTAFLEALAEQPRGKNPSTWHSESSVLISIRASQMSSVLYTGFS